MFDSDLICNSFACVELASLLELSYLYERGGWAELIVLARGPCARRKVRSSQGHPPSLTSYSVATTKTDFLDHSKHFCYTL